MPTCAVYGSGQIGSGDIVKADKIISAIEGVTKKWAKQRKAEERHVAAANNRRYVMTRSAPDYTIKSAAWTVMETAYLKVSENGTLPALARQIMYAARPFIQERTGKPLNDKYFTQVLLPDYMSENREKCADWNVVFDARGHLHEPHTGREVPLGTIEIRNYLQAIASHTVEDPSFDVREEHYPTLGSKHRYGDILFIEKEGFMPLFDAVQLAERYDIAIMSTKGMSVTACRELVDTLCASLAGLSVRLLVFHDFDKSGFSIVGTLKRRTRRYAFKNTIDVIDVGMRIGDIGGLQREASNIPESTRGAARRNLKENGATPEESEFLLKERVELNAFTSQELVTWIESKLVEHGVKKVLPDDDTLSAAYRRAREHAAVQKMIDEAAEALREKLKAAAAPTNLRTMVEESLKADPTRTWDSVIMEIVAKQ
jgi:hypothetical protein